MDLIDRFIDTTNDVYKHNYTKELLGCKKDGFVWLNDHTRHDPTLSEMVDKWEEIAEKLLIKGYWWLPRQEVIQRLESHGIKVVAKPHPSDGMITGTVQCNNMVLVFG